MRRCGCTPQEEECLCHEGENHTDEDEHQGRKYNTPTDVDVVGESGFTPATNTSTASASLRSWPSFSPTLLSCTPTWSLPGRCWSSNSAQHRPKSIHIWSGQRGPTLVGPVSRHMWPLKSTELGRRRPHLGHIRRGFGPMWADVGLHSKKRHCPRPGTRTIAGAHVCCEVCQL